MNGPCERLDDLARNMWWSWNPPAGTVFSQLDPELWDQCGENPVMFLDKLQPSRIEEMGRDKEYIKLYNDTMAGFDKYMADTGIFEFFESLPGEIMKVPGSRFLTPCEAAENMKSDADLDVPDFVSWADLERDLTAWTGNDLQKAALETVYSLENEVREKKDPAVTETWRRLQTSDHFYYMCTKWFADGDVHKYFSPYLSPYDAHINYMNVLSDFREELK